MKNILHLSMVIFFVFCSLMVYGQDKCKVLKPEIAGTYEGKCKNGFANGKGIAVGTDRYEGQFIKGFPDGYGTYTWASGNIYTGEWTGGMRHGIGKYIIKSTSADSIQDGLWQNDKYKGPKPRNPYISYKDGVDRYSFQKNNTTKNRVLIDIFQNGVRNRTITNFVMSTTSGSDTKVGESVGFDYIIFPVSIKVMYTSMNKLQTISYNVKFEFEIFEPGDWTLTLDN
jgi:hypothetical protein